MDQDAQAKEKSGVNYLPNHSPSDGDRRDMCSVVSASAGAMSVLFRFDLTVSDLAVVSSLDSSDQQATATGCPDRSTSSHRQELSEV
jgi:hypothetical protein